MKRSKFSLSNYKLFTCDMGELIPCGVLEVLPGDSIQQNTSLLIRCSPLLAPVMHPVHVRIHHWYVPYRLVWEGFEDFITGGPDGMNSAVFPYMGTTGGVAIGSLADYMGIPALSPNVNWNALPFRAYQLIWNEFYRDQDLQAEAPIEFGGGLGAADGLTSKSLQRVGWEKDYFTSARPWEQKGPAITIPISGINPVTFRETGATPGVRTIGRAGSGAGSSSSLYMKEAGTTNASITGEVDLSSASSVTVNVLREAMALQRYEEARARYGSRYTEYLRYLGVRSSDARLQRPEYLGGGRQTIQFSEVLQTAEGSDPVGEMRGHGISALRSNRYRRFIEEHGVIISLLSVRPKTMYSQGLPRMWSRLTKEDFWQKELQHIGQQEVLNKEIYAAHSTPNGVFGFQDRYDEYRRQENTIAGEFQSVLNHWHFGRNFTSSPALNASFVSCVPTENPFAAQDNDVLWVMANHSIQARRMVSKTGASFGF